MNVSGSWPYPPAVQEAMAWALLAIYADLEEPRVTGVVSERAEVRRHENFNTRQWFAKFGYPVTCSALDFFKPFPLDGVKVADAELGVELTEDFYEWRVVVDLDPREQPPGGLVRTHVIVSAARA